jgi:hypothetical protein
MTRTVCLACCAALLSCHSLASAGQQPVSESTTVALTATIEAIDKATRTVTLKKDDGSSMEIDAPAEMEGFNTLKVGDRVTATYYEAVVVNIRKPGDPAPAAPITTIERKDRKPGSESRRQQTFRVTVASVDPKAQTLTVKGEKGRVVVLKVQDPKSLPNVKAGDTVDVTYFESLLVNVSRPPK